MKKAILYLQFASIEQAKKDEQAQKEYDFAEKHCAENGIEIIRVFDEISIKPPRERYYFDKALKVTKALADQLTYFIVMDYSRISKKYEEFKEIQEELSVYGIHIYSIYPRDQFLLVEYFNKLNIEK